MISKRTNDTPSDALTFGGTSSSEVRARLASWRSTITHELTERPFRTLSLAVGAGYLLGGGLFSRLTWRAANLALRFGFPSLLGLLEDEGAQDARGATDASDHSPKRDLGSGKRKHT
jgi:hypothetical protein